MKQKETGKEINKMIRLLDTDLIMHLTDFTTDLLTRKSKPITCEIARSRIFMDIVMHLLKHSFSSILFTIAHVKDDCYSMLVMLMLQQIDSLQDICWPHLTDEHSPKLLRLFPYHSIAYLLLLPRHVYLDSLQLEPWICLIYTWQERQRHSDHVLRKLLERDSVYMFCSLTFVVKILIIWLECISQWE